MTVTAKLSAGLTANQKDSSGAEHSFCGGKPRHVRARFGAPDALEAAGRLPLATTVASLEIRAGRDEALRGSPDRRARLAFSEVRECSPACAVLGHRGRLNRPIRIRHGHMR